MNKENILDIVVFISAFSIYSFACFILQRECHLLGTVCIIGITFSIWALIRYFIINKMQKSFEVYISNFIEEYPKKIRKICEKEFKEEYIYQQKKILEELQEKLQCIKE